MKIDRLTGLLGLAAGLTALPISAAEPLKLSPKEAEFFETKIRPLFVENCYKCHSQGAERIKGGLVLDSREGWMKGGNTGPAIIPGNLDKSLLIQAVRYKDPDVQMPPNDRKLSNQQIADLEAWVRMGAPDPRLPTEGKKEYKLDIARARQHWAYQPVKKPAVPAVNDAQGWSRTPVDSFILQKLQQHSLAPSVQADKVTLIRRATFDLHGLPPSLKEVDDFLADSSADAFAEVVDRLLASPRYGERWGRHWLDLAKYADTKGQVGQNTDPRYLWSWTYRDWVIRSLNEDLPYDQFILQQLAADQLPQGEDKRALAALGFLTLGNRFNGQANDIIDDRIDLIGKAMLATTVACARCHDHKFDPIPTKDYYSLHGIFASSSEPREGPVLEEPKDTPAYRTYLKDLAAAEAAVENFREETGRKLAVDRLKNTGEYWLALHDFKSVTNGMSRNAFIQRRALSGTLAGAWNEAIKGWRSKHHPIYAPWVAFEALDEREFAAKARELSAKFYANSEKGKPLNPMVAKLFANPPASLKQLAARYEALLVDVDRRWQAVLEAHEARKRAASTPPPAPALSEPDADAIRKVMNTRGQPTYLDEGRIDQLINNDNRLRDRLNALRRAVNDVKTSHPGSPPRAHVMVDGSKPRDSYVFLRGNPGSRGPVAPRQFLEVLSSDSRAPYKQGSGRLELAKAIASADNPLTARVLVNRVWLHHFGEGFVATPDDFGTRADAPSHPELLDYLAATFVEGGWSLKKLHRLIMLSAVYQQASEDNPRFAQIDPGNRWLWQMNRRRLNFEALRDAILFIGNKLDLAQGGPSVRLNSEPYSRRRSVYGYVDRNAVPNMYLTFDFANPDLTTGKRETTIVPQQALFLMNSPLVIEQARDLVRRDDFKRLTSERDQLSLLYRLIYQRAPTEMEAKLALEFIHAEAGGKTTGAQVGQTAWEYGYGTLDFGTKRVKSFVRMTTFREGAWRPNVRANDNKLGPLAITADGGLPGVEQAAIRRWTAPRDGFISIDGVLGHSGKPGDGVRGLIISSSTGMLGTWGAHDTNQPTRLPRVLVKRGDTIDFFVSALANTRNDNFNWSPVIRMTDGRTAAGDVASWDAKKEFRDAVDDDRLGAWEKFAQVLLETNELTFVN